MANKTNKRNKGRRTRGESVVGDVVTLRGQQNYVQVKNGASGTQLFTSNNIVQVSPDAFGTRVAELANAYNMYRFSRLDIEYKPLNYNEISANDDFTAGVPNALSSNLFAFGYEDDGVLTFTVTYDSISQLRYNIITPIQGYASRNDNRLRVRPAMGDKWYYCKNDTTTDADIRQTIQGTLFGESKQAFGSTAYLWGDIHINYTIHFKEACPTQGVTISTMIKELALGKLDKFKSMLKRVNHVVLHNIYSGVIPQNVLDSYTNEEYYEILGKHRTHLIQPTDVDPKVWKACYDELGKITSMLEFQSIH